MPEAVVLSFDMTGGQRPRTGDGPILLVRADGTVTARALKPGDPAITTRLDKDALSALFDELVDEIGVLGISTSVITEEIAASAVETGRTRDVPSTTLSIVLPEGRMSAEVKGVSALANQAPDATMLHRLFRVQRMLLDRVKRLNERA